MQLTAFSDFIYHSHTLIGSLALIGAIVALSTKKGSKFHKLGGKVFFVCMLYAAISVVKFMMDELRPLAILMSVATIYLMITAISALRNKRIYATLVDSICIVFPFLISGFAAFQFVLILPEISIGTLSRFLIASTFALLFYRDVKRLRGQSLEPMFYFKRHAFRMILAFGFAIMALLRIGVKLDFLGLETTVAFPMLVALGCAFYVERNIEKMISSNNSHVQ